MTDYFTRHFVGSLFSIKFVWAYGIAASFVTGFQLLLVVSGAFVMPETGHNLPIFLDLLMETLVPWWIPPITGYNIAIVMMNLFGALGLLAIWSSRYDSAMRRGRREF